MHDSHYDDTNPGLLEFAEAREFVPQRLPDSTRILCQRTVDELDYCLCDSGGS